MHITVLKLEDWMDGVVDNELYLISDSYLSAELPTRIKTPATKNWGERKARILNQ